MAWLDRLLQLASRQRPSGTSPDQAAHYAVIDTETTGLDTSRDRLLSIGAVAVSDGRIQAADSFYAVLRQQAPSRSEDILIHHVGTGEQAAGREPALVLDAFRDWCGHRWAVAFHASFDQRMLARTYREHRCSPPALAGWMDLAVLAPVLFPERATAVSLDDWLTSFGIDDGNRHNALGDAFATAKLLLPVLAAARARGLGAPSALAAESRAAERLRLMR